MSWLGWCLIGIAVYAVVILLRSLVDVVNWFVDFFVREPRELKKLREAARQRRKRASAGSAQLPRAGAPTSQQPTPTGQHQEAHQKTH